MAVKETDKTALASDGPGPAVPDVYDPIDEIAKKLTDPTLIRMVKQRKKFDGYYHFYYLFNRKLSEERDPLLFLLSKRHEGVIHFYLPQLCQLAIERSELTVVQDEQDPTDFGKFITNKSANSMHFALKADWQFKAIADDHQSQHERDLSTWLSEKIETAVVNAKVERTARNFEPSYTVGTLNRVGSKCSIDEPTPRMLEPNLRERIVSALPHQSKFPDELTLPTSWGSDSVLNGPITYFTNPTPNETIPTIWQSIEHPAEACQRVKTRNIAPDLIWFLSKQIRCEYFGMTGKFCSYLIQISDCLANEPERSERLNLAIKCFQKINHWIFCRRAIVAAAEQAFCMKGFCIPMDRIGPDPEIWTETGKELRTEWDNRTVEVVNNPGWEEGTIQNTPNAVQILRIASKECRVISSAKRAPYLIVMETGDLDEDVRKLVTVPTAAEACPETTTTLPSSECTEIHTMPPDAYSSRYNHPQAPYCWNDLYTYDCVLRDLKNFHLYIPKGLDFAVRKEEVNEAVAHFEKGTSKDEVASPLIRHLMTELEAPENPLDCIRRSLRLFDGDLNRDLSEELRSMTSTSNTIAGIDSPPSNRITVSSSNPFAIPEGYNAVTWAPLLRKQLWGESWHDKKQRLRENSPYGRLQSWDMHAVLVKGGDDLRQEFLAQQLIRVFRAIFEEAGHPLWVRPYEILVTGHNSGIMEFVPDSASFGALKQKYGNESFARCFEAAFADKLEQAQYNFLHSHAAYSLISYLLNVKDRHNGNLLLLTSGHCVHIDFGFMLSNAPGNNIANAIAGGAFENSPFKLTQEIMDILGGQESDMFEYFKRLIIYGFLGVRKSAERVLQLVEMMEKNYKMPCFSENPSKTLEEMKERFMLDIPDDQCISNIQSLITLSINNWRSVQYDYYQKHVNKIW